MSKDAAMFGVSNIKGKKMTWWHISCLLWYILLHNIWSGLLGYTYSTPSLVVM